MNPQTLERSARTLLSSVITGGGWLASIEDMAGRMNVLGGGIARVVPPKMFAIPSSGVREQFLDMQAGRAPTLTKETPLTPSADGGFVAEHIGPHGAMRRRTVFHQEFLRPRGCAHNVSAVLDATPAGTVNFLAYRPECDGIFQEHELKAFDAMLPYLRSAAIVSRGVLSGEAQRKAEPFERRGEPVLYLDADGRTIEINPAAERSKGRLFGLVDRHVTTVVGADQTKFDRALTAALSHGRPGLVALTTLAATGTVMALVLPVDGDARDLFRTVSALVVFIDQGSGPATDEAAMSLLRDAAHLTGREAEVVRLVASGSTPREAGERLGIGFGTVRLHLKAAFAKLGVHGQVELADLVRRLA